MKLLVTGGCGFIGSNFILWWREHYPADFIVNLDALTYAGNPANLAALANDRHYQFVKGDIGDRELVKQLVPEADCVVHLAAETHVDRSIAASDVFVRTNVLGTQCLLEAARIKQTRFHHVSTDEVFGALSLTDRPFNETTPYNPRSPYSASKAASDHLARAYWHTYGLPITISNCSNNYGPRQFPEKLLPLAITNLLDNKTVPIYGQGANIRDWLYVDDHSAGLAKIILGGRPGETYCLGGGSELNNLALVRRLLALLGKDDSAISYVADRPGHDLRYAIDFSKINQELGWQPQVGLGEGLAQTVRWYQANEAWWRPLLTKQSL